MIEGQFDVVFRGQILKTTDVAEVKLNLAKLFKSTPESVDKLFVGGEVAIKKSLDYATAMKYQSVLKKAGALALIKEVEVAEHNSSGRIGSEPSSINQDKQSDVKVPVEQSIPQPNIRDLNAKGKENPSTTPIQEDGSVLEVTLAKAGERILPEKIYQQREVDTSALSLASVGERLMPPKEPDKTPPPPIDHLSLE
jgi:hypothetical protein